MEVVEKQTGKEIRLELIETKNDLISKIQAARADIRRWSESLDTQEAAIEAIELLIETGAI